MGQPLYCSAADAGLCGERPWGCFHPLCMTQQYRLASMAAWLSSTISSLTSSRSISPQSTAPLTLGLLHNPETPASNHCTFQGTSVLVRGMYDCCKDCLILIPFRLSQISCFTLSLKCFSSDSDNCPDVGIRPLLQFPYPPRAGPVLLTLLFSPRVPSSCRVLHGSIYSFPLVKYSYLLSAGILHALLCLKVYC